MSLKKVFIVLVVLDVVLGIIAYVVVFYSSPGTYDVAALPIPATTILPATSTIALAAPSSTATSTETSISSGIGMATTSIGTILGNPSTANYGTAYGIPYPVNWAEGDASISVMAASLQGNQLTFNLVVAMGNTMQCVPLNIRMLVDEQGDLVAPVTPQFTFPESNACQGAPGATYTDQAIVFDVDPTAFPLFFTTGGASNLFFQVATTSDGGLTATIPNRPDSRNH